MPEFMGGNSGSQGTAPGAGSGFVVTDGTHTISNISTIDFTAGAGVSAGNPGVALVNASGTGTVPGAGIVASNGTHFTDATIASGLSLSVDGQTLTNAGVLSLAEGTSTLSGAITLAASGAVTLAVAGQTLTISAPTFTVPGAGFVASNGTALVDGTIAAGLSLSPDRLTLANAGVLDFIASGTTITGGVSLAAAGAATLAVSGSVVTISAPASVLALTAGAGIGIAGSLANETISNTGVLALTAGAGIGITGSTTNETITNSGVLQFGTDTGTIHVGSGLTEASGTLSAQWTAGAVSTVVGGAISGGTLTIDAMQANFDFAGTGPSWPGAVYVPVTQTVVVGATFANSQLFNGAAATGTVNIAASYIHSGTTTSIGNLIFAPGGPTLGSSSAVTLVPGNTLKFAPSTTADATAADLAGAISLSRVGP